MKTLGNKTIFDEDVSFEGGVLFLTLPTNLVDKFPPTNTTPSVKNVTRIKANNTGAVTITDLLYGADGQEVKILGDGFTTVQHGTKIFTNTAANKLMAANKIYTFTKFGTAWYENA